MPQRPCAGRAACQRHIGIELRHRLKPANRLHGDRKQAEHGHDHDFTGNLETEPDQKQRCDRNQRHRLRGRQQREQRGIGNTGAIQQNPDQDAACHGQQESDGAFQQRDFGRGPQGRPCFDGRLRDFAGGGDHRGWHVPQSHPSLPYRQQQHDGDHCRNTAFHHAKQFVLNVRFRHRSPCFLRQSGRARDRLREISKVRSLPANRPEKIVTGSPV